MAKLSEVPREGIDRLAPTRRPPGVVVMRQVWSDLLFLHWAVPVDDLRALIPEGLEIDTFEGRAYVGLVPFLMEGVRPVFVPPVPGISRFEEVNVRTYVHREGRDPGVWFFSLDAANRLAVALARGLWHLPYHHARMSLDRLEPGGTPHPAACRISYTSNRRGSGPPASCALRYTPEGVPAPALAGTLEHFLIERYILYARRNETLYKGRVYHPAYPVQSARLEAFEENLLAAAGIPRPDEAPLIHYARQVRVRIYPPSLA